MEGRLSKPIRVSDGSVIKLFSIPLSQGKWVVEYNIRFVSEEPTYINQGFVLESVDGVVKNERLAISKFSFKHFQGSYNGKFEVDGDSVASISVKYNVEKGWIEFNECDYKVYQLV